jgi:hypothetical protein
MCHLQWKCLQDSSDRSPNCAKVLHDVLL